MRTCVHAQTRARVCGCVCGVGVIVGDGEEVFQERVMFDLNLEAWLGVHGEKGAVHEGFFSSGVC